MKPTEQIFRLYQIASYLLVDIQEELDKRYLDIEEDSYLNIEGEEPNWGHVGNLTEINNRLNELLTFIRS